MLTVLFEGVPMLGSLGTFSMFMYGIFLTDLMMRKLLLQLVMGPTTKCLD